LLGDRDENSSRDVAKLLKGFDKLVEETGAASIIVHHFSKRDQAGKAVGDAGSGSGVWFRDVDTHIEFKPLSIPGSFRADVVVRNLPPVASFGISWNYPVWQRDSDANIEDLATSGGRIKIKPTVLLFALKGVELTYKEWF